MFWVADSVANNELTRRTVARLLPKWAVRMGTLGLLTGNNHAASLATTDSQQTSVPDPIAQIRFVQVLLLSHSADSSLVYLKSLLEEINYSV